MATVNVEAIEHVGLVEGIGVGVAYGQRLRCHHLTADALAVGLDKFGNLGSVPQTAGILCGPVWLVLDGDGIEFDTVIAQILHVVFQILSIVSPVLAFQLARGAVFVLGIAGAVGFPFGRLSPGRGKDDESQLLGLLGGSQRLTPGITSDGDVEAHDVTAHRTTGTPHLLDFRGGHVVVTELRRADKAAKSSNALVGVLYVKACPRLCLPIKSFSAS